MLDTKARAEFVCGRSVARTWVCLALAGVLGLVGARTGSGGMLRTQTVELQTGWNAVYLELDPTQTDPATLFAGQPVDVVASFVAPAKGAQFVRNPTASLLSSFGWSVWYAPARSDAFLTSLHALYGGKPYLIHATTNATLTYSGEFALEALVWTPDAYNFVGFTVADPGAPTFQQFFGGSPAHNHNKIYRMVEGTWRQVIDPAAQTMRAGEAFWIYCDGRSDYPGPLQVSARSHLGVNLWPDGGDEVVFRNRTDHPVSFWVEHLVDPAHPVPLSTPVQTMDEAAGGLRTLTVNFDGAHFQQQFPALEAGAAIRLPLELRSQDAGVGIRFSLLKVVTDLGTISYLPVTTSRDDQSSPAE